MDIRRKILLVLVTIIAVAGAFLAAFWPTKPKPATKKPAGALERYQLPADYTKEDVFSLVDKMAMDREFRFYFLVLDEERRQDIINRSAEVLLNAESPSEIFEAIQQEYENINAISVTFYYLHYPPAYARQPSRFPQLESAFWEFIEEEFFMTVLGVVYKVNYDQDFKFQWPRTSVLAAQKLRKIWAQRQEHVQSLEG